jgi:hypothetical protein
MPEPSILDAHLAEIDRRLRMIQSGLEPVRDDDPGPEAAPTPDRSAPLAAPDEPEMIAPTPLRPSRAPAPPLSDPDDRDDEIAVLTARLAELTAAHERLLAATQDLLIEQADVLSRAAPALAVSAGPFTDAAALQAFRGSLSELPQVREVTIREYVGTEHAVLDVHLLPPIS